jgi:hypothetical protein
MFLFVKKSRSKAVAPATAKLTPPVKFEVLLRNGSNRGRPEASAGKLQGKQKLVHDLKKQQIFSKKKLEHTYQHNPRLIDHLNIDLLLFENNFRYKVD